MIALRRHRNEVLTMVSDKHGLKDQLVGTYQEAKGKITGDKKTEVVGKARKAKGKAKDKVTDVKDCVEE